MNVSYLCVGLKSQALIIMKEEKLYRFSQPENQLTRTIIPQWMLDCSSDIFEHRNYEASGES